MNKWIQISIGEFIDFNPSESISKGSIARKIGMDKLGTFQRKINGFEFLEYSAGPKFRNKDTLVAKITPCLENGKTAYVDVLEENEVAYGSSEFIVLRENEKSDSKFIYYLARSPWFRERAISCMEGTSGRKRVNEGALKRQEILVPASKSEQQKIAAVLSALDDKIELNNTINAELEAMAKTLYDYWFVQFEFPNSEGKPYKSSGGAMEFNPILKREIPKGWEVRRFGDLVKSINTGLNPRNHFKLGNGENYYITIKNIEYGVIKFDNSCDKIDNESMERIQKRSNLEKGDILFTSIEPVGKTYLLQENPKNWNINESVFSLKPNLELLSSEYLFMLASSDEMKFKCRNSSTGSIHKGIRITPLKEFNFCYPKFDIIQKFTKKISPILRRIDLNQKQNQELAQLRDWLLPMLMNGQVKVVDEQYNTVNNVVSMAAESNTNYSKGSQALV